MKQYLLSKLKIIVPIFIFAVVGAVAIFISFASTRKYIAVEPEAAVGTGSITTIADAAASGGQAIQFTTPPSNGTLPIPSTLSTNWTAPAGNYTMPAQAVDVSGAVTVNLSAATITGNTGYLFNLMPGSNLTIVGGKLSGTILGLVQDNIADGATASVIVKGTIMTNVRSVVFAKAQGGPVSITLTDVNATGLGSGVRATSNYMYVDRSVLTGGGSPPSGEPAGVHTLDDNAGNISVAGSRLIVLNSTITGYVSSGFQGDSILGETRVESGDIENNTLGHNSDSGGVDSKMHSVLVKNNTIYSDGNRAIASHYGTLNASGNTIYQVATSPTGVGRAYQASGVLVASNDTLILATGGSLSQVTVVLKPGSGPPASYPRVGNMTLTHITTQNGTSILGPNKSSSAGGYVPSFVVYP